MYSALMNHQDLHSSVYFTSEVRKFLEAKKSYRLIHSDQFELITSSYEIILLEDFLDAQLDLMNRTIIILDKAIPAARSAQIAKKALIKASNGILRRGHGVKDNKDFWSLRVHELITERTHIHIERSSNYTLAAKFFGPWFPDPSDRHELRLRGSTTWTATVRDGEVQSIDPL